jgi:hypothetical protein
MPHPYALCLDNSITPYILFITPKFGLAGSSKS